MLWQDNNLEMMLGSLSFAAREWFWPALALFGASLLFIWFSYARAPLSPRLRIASFSLKALAIALLLICLLEPTWTTTRPREGANFFALVADNSMGLSIRDTGETQTRGERLREFLTSDQNGWQARLEQTYVPRRFVFDARLQSTRDFGELTLDGPASSIFSSLDNVARRFQGQPLAGVLLFTDGNATDLPEGGLELPGLPPVYPVILGSESRMRDVALGKVTVSQSAFEDAPVTIVANALALNMRGETVTARLTLDGKTVAEEQQPVRTDDDRLAFRFQVKPEKFGITFYEMELIPKESANGTPEATLHNNKQTVTVDRGQGPYRILYVSGRPNWEFKFLNRALYEDTQLHLVGLIRVAKREPKFTFRGRAGESSNPLFRGFNQVDEETERYDQPVLIRLNTRDDLELKGGFPKIPEDLYQYDAVVLDDVEAAFFTPDQKLLLQRFVSDRGGGLMMLGGADSLQDGKYARTPIGDMLPVYLEGSQPPAASGEYRLDLTREGWLEPWVRLRGTESEERNRLAALPGFQVVNPIRDIKPGAIPLAKVTGARGELPALVVQRFGQGRTAVLAIGDLWMAGLSSEQAQGELGKTWRQMMRWVVTDVPPLVELTARPKSGDADGAMRLVVRARDKKFEPLENATVELSVTAPGGGETNRVTFAAEPSEGEAGVYEATYIPRASGAYLASARIVDAKGIKAGEAQTGWASEPLAREFENLNPNRGLLEEIARRTGGEVITMDKVEGLVNSLPERKAPIVETYSYPVWHRGSIFLLALGLFAGEWGLRRWKGLA